MEPETHREPRPDTIGFIGLGIMGKPMARNLVNARFDVVVHSRSQSPVDELVAMGATRAANPAEVAIRSDIMITMLPDTPDLQLVVEGPNGLLGAMRPGRLLIDMSTVDPIATRRLAEAVRAKGGGYVDAPVSGGQKGAEDATLSIMVGGSDRDVARAMPVLRALGKTVVHVGDVGAGQVAKAANQLVVGVTIEAVAEALALAEAAGVDAGKVREALLGGFAASRILEVHGQRMLDEAFTPGFRARLHLKDAGIVQSMAGELGIGVPALDIVRERLGQLVDSGRGDLDHSALVVLTRVDRAD
jgi:2-hydroxy-3-oxopropionate reductase